MARNGATLGHQLKIRLRRNRLHRDNIPPEKERQIGQWRVAVVSARAIASFFIGGSGAYSDITALLLCVGEEAS